jgi:hypothetical protein
MARCPEEVPELYNVNGTLVRCFLHDKRGTGDD